MPAPCCNSVCAYCIVPSVRGRERSRPVGDVLDETAALAEDGVREVTLLGQNVNSYGRDLPRDGRATFAELLRAVAGVDGIDRVRYTSPHPKDMRDDVIAAMADCSAVCQHLHLPAQSGSTKVLRAMRRTYSRERYLDLVTRLRAAMPDISLTTDLIVGFPGETEADFQATLDVVTEARFDQAFTFQYSARPGTVAATLDGHLEKGVVQERFERLVALQNAISLETNQTMVGSVEEVLVEGPSKKDPRIMTARTRGNKPVHAPGSYDPGTYLKVQITQAAPHHLLGTVIS